MELAEIQEAIESLTGEQRTALLSWLGERENLESDSQIERDFSPSGAGIALLDHVKDQIRRGESVPMDEHDWPQPRR